MIQHRATILLAMAMASFSTPALLAQKWEVGGGGGASFYTSQTINSPYGSAEAKFKPGYGFTGYLGQLGNKLGGEFRYSFLQNNMELTSGSKVTSMNGRSQTFEYDLHIYLSGHKESKTRAYAIAGGGMKLYQGTGDDVALQPTGNIAVLTRTNEWKPLLTFGGGIRFAVSRSAHIRADMRVNMTQAPTNVITPVTGDLTGWFFSFVPMVSVSYVW